MQFNVPEDQKPEFNKKVKGSLELLTSGVTQKLGQLSLEAQEDDTLVAAYNQPVTEQELAQVPPSDMVTVDPKMARRIEINSLRTPDGNIYNNAEELFSQPVNYNQFKALGFVDQDGNATPEGELFVNLKDAGMFNEDGTVTEKGQAYLLPEQDIGKPENLKAFTTLFDDQVIRPESTWDEKVESVTDFGKNVITGLYDTYRLGQKITSPTGIYDIIKGTISGDKTIAEQQVGSLAVLEQTSKNFQQAGGWADILQGLAGSAIYQGIDAVNKTQLTKELVDAADENLYAARQRQWQANQNIQDLEVGQIAEGVFGLDGAVKMAEEAKQTLGDEQFKRAYSGRSALTELVVDPSAAIPATKAFTIAKSVPVASRAIIGAQKILGETAQVDMAIAKAAEVVETGNAFLRKEALSVDLAKSLSKDISSRAVGNPELLARAKQAEDAAQRITASANDIRAAMPNAVKTLEDLTAKRNSLATKIPEAYAQKVLQTAELGRKIRSMPARTISSMLERTGETLTKVDDSVTTYLQDKGLDQAYNAALGASGIVGLAGNPIVGAVGVAGATLKAGKFLTEYGKILRYVGKEMENARGQIPFWKRVAAHTAPGSLGRGIAHTFNIFELGGATSDIIRRTGRGMVAAYPSDLFFEWLSDGGDMRPETMTQAAAESYVIGGSFAAGGGAFMGTKKRMRDLSIGDEINFRQGLTDTRQKALFEALPPAVRRSISTYSMANPTLNYNFSDTGASNYDPNTNTATINIGSTNPLKALVAHETLHHTLIKNNMEGGIAALFLGDTKTNSVGGLLRSKDGTLDPEFERFTNTYYNRLREAGMSDAQINTTYPLDKVAVEYFIEQHADQYSTMAESGELGALAARGEVRKKLGSVLETVLPKIPVLRDLHIKSGGMIDGNGAWVTGNGLLGADGIRQNPVANKMFREMNRRSTGVVPGQFEPLISDKEGSGAPLLFDPSKPIDAELMHPFIQVDENDKPILKDGRPVFIDKSVDVDRAMAGLTAVEAMRKRRESNYVPEKGEAYVDDDGELQPGWLSDAVLTEMFAKHKFNNEQKRMIRQTNKLIKQGAGQRMVMINFPATTRLKSGKVVYAPQKAAIRDAVPVAITISKDGNILYGVMSVTKLQENIKKRAQSRKGKKLYGGNIDLILRDTQAMMDFHKKGEDSINYFSEKYGAVEADQRKKFINTMFGLLNKKEQAVLNPMLLEDGIKSSDNVYRTYRADRVSKAIPMAPEEYQAMPFSYEAVSQVRMPEARQMPEGAYDRETAVKNKQVFADRFENFQPQVGVSGLLYGWQRPSDGKFIKVDQHQFFYRDNYGNQLGDPMSIGYLRIVKEGNTLFYEGNPNPKQLKELKDTAIENDLELYRSNYYSNSDQKPTRFMPEGDPTLDRLREVRDGLDADLTEQDALNELDFIIGDAPEGFFPQDIVDKIEQAKQDVAEEYTTWAGRGESMASVEDAVASAMRFLDSKEGTGQNMRFMPKATDVSPEDLNPVANRQEAEGLFADGKSLFAFNEMEETVTPITSREMLNAYPPDAIGWMEPEAQSAMRFMPEGYKSHHDETLIKSAWDGKELDLSRPFKANESLPSLAMRTKWEEKPIVNQDSFDFKKKASVVFGKNKNGNDVTIKFDPKLINAPNIVDFADVYAGEQIQYTIADRMSAVDGDMGGPLHPFLKNNDVVIDGPDGKKYVVAWGNNSATVGTKMRRKAKDGAEVLMVYLMGNDAHQSNTRTVRLFDTQLENSSMPSYMVDIARAYSYIPIKEIKHSSALKEVERIDGLLKKAEKSNKGSDYINKLKNDRDSSIKLAQQFKISSYDQELSSIFRKVKSSQTRLDNGIGKQSTVDANIKELSKFATSAKGKKLIKEIPSKFIYEMTGTFDGRKSAVSQISNLKLYDFDGNALSSATADMVSADKNAIVTAIDLSKNQNFFMLYMGDDQKQINAMTSEEKAAAEKLKKNANFVVHEAYDTLILSPLEGRRNLNSRMENALDAVPDSFQSVLEDRPSVKEKVGKTNAQGNLILSEDNLLNTVRDQQSVPLIYNPRK